MVLESVTFTTTVAQKLHFTLYHWAKWKVQELSCRGAKTRKTAPQCGPVLVNSRMWSTGRSRDSLRKESLWHCLLGKSTRADSEDLAFRYEPQAIQMIWTVIWSKMILVLMTQQQGTHRSLYSKLCDLYNHQRLPENRSTVLTTLKWSDPLVLPFQTRTYLADVYRWPIGLVVSLSPGWVPGSVVGGSADAAETFSSSLLLRQAALGLRFLSIAGENWYQFVRRWKEGLGTGLGQMAQRLDLQAWLVCYPGQPLTCGYLPAKNKACWVLSWTNSCCSFCEGDQSL